MHCYSGYNGVNSPDTNLWHTSCAENFSAASLDGAIDVDLVIVGGGFTGLSAALRAAQGGARVAVLEAHEIGHGGSGRNVGLCNAGLWLPPDEIRKRVGEEAGNRLIGVLADAPTLVYDLIEKHSIACEPVRQGTLHCAHSAGGFGDLQERFRQQQAMGAPVSLLSAAEARARVGSDSVFGALFDPRAGTVQPLGYAKGLARAAVSVGAQVFENAAALSVSWSGAFWEVTTSSGTVRAKALVQATNAYQHPESQLRHPKLVPVHYFQAATEPLPEDLRKTILSGGEGCWDTATVMSSWRLDQAGRLVIGAMGQLDHIASGIHASWLSRKMERLFPQLKGQPFTHLWHGRIAMTAEYMPKIQRIGANAYSCFGYSGRGIAPGTLFGKALAESILSGSEDSLPVAPVDAHALPFASAKAIFYESGATLTHLVKDRF